jgi:hypothetical protein
MSFEPQNPSFSESLLFSDNLHLQRQILIQQYFAIMATVCTLLVVWLVQLCSKEMI